MTGANHGQVDVDVAGEECGEGVAVPIVAVNSGKMMDGKMIARRLLGENEGLRTGNRGRGRGYAGQEG